MKLYIKMYLPLLFLFMTGAAEAVWERDAEGMPVLPVGRFARDAYLEKGFSGGDPKTFTFSFWFKQDEAHVGRKCYFLRMNNDRPNYFIVELHGSDGYGCLNFTNRLTLRRNGKDEILTGPPDICELSPSIWHHVVVSVDTQKEKEADRLRLFLNGHLVTPLVSYNTETGREQPRASISLGDTAYYGWNKQTAIGGYNWNYGGNPYFSGLMADIYGLDGIAREAQDFGEIIETPLGQRWVPKPYGGDYGGGDYGKNGFHLDFSDKDRMGKDVSRNKFIWDSYMGSFPQKKASVYHDVVLPRKKIEILQRELEEERARVRELEARSVPAQAMAALRRQIAERLLFPTGASS